VTKKKYKKLIFRLITFKVVSIIKHIINNTSMSNKFNKTSPHQNERYTDDRDRTNHTRPYDGDRPNRNRQNNNRPYDGDRQNNRQYDRNRSNNNRPYDGDRPNNSRPSDGDRLNRNRPNDRDQSNRNRPNDRDQSNRNRRDEPAGKDNNEECLGKSKECEVSEYVELERTDFGTTELPEMIDDFENMKFLSEQLFNGVFKYGFKYPSPIQARTIHIINSGCDLIAQSQAGTGKTGAFTIGSLSRIDPTNRYPQILIIANTRALADQILKVVENISYDMKIRCCLCSGGTNTHDNGSEASTSHVLVGTPGRILELIEKDYFDGRRLKTLILDESDELLKDDFRPQIMDIMGYLGRAAQRCIFSATFTKETLKLTESFLNNPYRITVEKEEVSLKNVLQYKINVRYDNNKFAVLDDLFGRLSITQMIVFVNSAKTAIFLRNKLMDNSIEAGLIHGKMNNVERETILKEFRLAKLKVLISTDIMCRGIDIDDLRIVINYDMSHNQETYIHRIGRSGRFGSKGIAINFCTYDDICKIRMIERDYMVSIPDMPHPDDINEYLTGIVVPTDKVLGSKNYDE